MTACSWPSPPGSLILDGAEFAASWMLNLSPSAERTQMPNSSETALILDEVERDARMAARKLYPGIDEDQLSMIIVLTMTYYTLALPRLF